MRGACHFVPCARPPGEAVSGAGEVCGCEGGGSRGQGLLSTGRFYLAPALWPLRPRVPRIYVFRVMCGGRLHGADGHGVSRGRGGPARQPRSGDDAAPRLRRTRRGPSGHTLLRAPAAGDATRLRFSVLQDARGVLPRQRYPQRARARARVLPPHVRPDARLFHRAPPLHSARAAAHADTALL